MPGSFLKSWAFRTSEGETLRDVALRYAVKPEKIMKKNGLAEGQRLHTGQVLWLR